MKKQFYRVKQLADQRTGRAEKTEILNEDLQNAEKKVEKIKSVCQTLTKRLHPCMQSSGGDIERRLRKLPHLALAQSMQETALMMGEESILGNMVRIYGNSQSELAKDIAEYELQVEKTVIAPFQQVIENDIPSINQNKKRLNKTGLDIDSLRSRYQAAIKEKESPKTKDPLAAEAKAEQLKLQYEEDLNKFQSLKDSYITEMLTLVAKEDEYADHITRLLKAQLDFHRKAVKHLEGIMPELNNDQGVNRAQASIFGCALEKHLKNNKREISSVIEDCVRFIYQNAMETEGLFRIAGQSTKVKKLKASIDTGLLNMEDFEYDIHAVTGALKQYLRELPEPLMTFEYYNEWIESASIRDRDERLQRLWTVMSKLPKENTDNLRYLMKFLTKIQENSETTKMNSHNLAIVMAPNLMWSIDNESSEMSVKNTGVLASIVESLIEHANWFFPDDIDFSKPTSECSAKTTNENPRPVFKENLAVRKQLSSEEYSKTTLLDEAASLVEVKSINNLENDSSSLEPVSKEEFEVISLSDTPSPDGTKKRAPLVPKQPLSPTISKNVE